MADGNYARLREGVPSFAALVPAKARKQYTPKVQRSGVCASPSCGAVYSQVLERQRYCSAACRNRESNRAGQEKRRNSEPRPCRWCGTVYAPEYGSLRTHYCTLDCRDAAKRKVRSGSSHRRRAEKHGVPYEPVSKRKVFERDGWRCYLCGVDTPKDLSGTTEANAPELEHVVPLSGGGAHSYENARCACRRCNRLKGAKSIDAMAIASPGPSCAAWAASADPRPPFDLWGFRPRDRPVPFVFLNVDKKDK